MSVSKTPAELAENDLAKKINQVVAVLAQAVREHALVIFSNSMGAEDMLLTDLINRYQPDIAMFSLDTGRLSQETYDLMQTA